MSLVPPLLVSFPNQLTSKTHSLIAIDFAKEKAFWINLDNHVSDIGGGVSGICKIPGFIAICTQSVTPAIVILDHSTLDIVSVFELKYVKDPHSIVFSDSYLYIVSTGTNEIYRIKVKDYIIKNEELFWQYPGVKYDHDEVHLNGITVCNDRFIATAFGKKKNSKWDAAGHVFFTDTGEVLKENLFQPHTPLYKDTLLVFAESVTGTVYIYEQKEKSSWSPKIDFKVNGYARGILFYEDELLIGISSLRNVSKSRGVILKNQKEITRTSILHVNINDPKIRNIYDVSPFSKEIYDIISIENIKTLTSFYEALEMRVAAMQSTGELFAHQVTQLSEILNITQKNLNEVDKEKMLLSKKLNITQKNFSEIDKEKILLEKKLQNLESSCETLEEEVIRINTELKNIVNSYSWRFVVIMRNIFHGAIKLIYK